MSGCGVPGAEVSCPAYSSTVRVSSSLTPVRSRLSTTYSFIARRLGSGSPTRYVVGSTAGSTISNWSALQCPLRSSAVHDADIVVPVAFHHPEGPRRRAVVAVAVQHHRRIPLDARPPHQCLELRQVGNIAAERVLHVRVQTPSDRAGYVARSHTSRPGASRSPQLRRTVRAAVPPPMPYSR